MEYRANQENIINEIVQKFKSGKKLVVLNAPTGSGKTIINLVVGKMIRGAYITSPLRVLVEQVKNDLDNKFREDNLGWGVIGRDSYPCKYLIEKEGEKLDYNLRHSPEISHSQLKKQYEYKIKDLTASGAPCLSKHYVYGRDEDGTKKYVCPYKEEHHCPYYNDRDRAMTSINAVTTFDYFIRGIYDQDTGVKHISEDGWNERPLLVIDEAHFLPTKLADFFSINITDGGKSLPDFQYDLLIERIKEKIGGVTDLKQIADITIKEFLDLLVPYEEEQIAYLEKLEDDQNASEEGFDIDYFGKKMDIDKAIQKQQKLVDRLSFYRYILKAERIEWVFNMNDNGIYWKPYSPAPFIMKLWETFDHILLSSATFFDIPEYLVDLGLDKVDYDIINVDSIFDAKNGPIISIPGIRLNQKNFDTMIDRVVKEIDNILDKHKNERGIIHCHTYQYQKEIRKRSRYSDRFIVHGSNDRQEILNKFTSLTDGNSVLLSVNMGEGIDLIDDKARFQILVKCPYPYKGDPWIKLHYERSSRWYRQQTVIEIMQIAGRVIRSKDDWATTYFIDGNILSLLSQVELPKWFSDRIKYGDEERRKRLFDEIDNLSI